MSSRLFIKSRVPSGSYFLGDPRDILDEWEWTQVSAHSLKHLASGTLLDGATVVAFETRTGSGVYKTNIPGLKIPTDSGLIGLVEAHTIDLEHYALTSGGVEKLADNVHYLSKGHGRYPRIIVDFGDEATCRQYDDGTLTFGYVTVTT